MRDRYTLEYNKDAQVEKTPREEGSALLFCQKIFANPLIFPSEMDRVLIWILIWKIPFDFPIRFDSRKGNSEFRLCTWSTRVLLVIVGAIGSRQIACHIEITCLCFHSAFSIKHKSFSSTDRVLINVSICYNRITIDQKIINVFITWLITIRHFDKICNKFCN